MKEFIISVFMFLVVEPMQAEWREALSRAGLTQELAGKATTCVAEAGPAIAERAWQDPWWGFTSAVYVAIGMKGPESVLEGVDPECARLIGSGVRLLNEQGA